MFNVLKDKLGNILNPFIPRYSYKVGDLFVTTNDENPRDRFGGTWRKLTDDAYLKIVTEKAGQTGGTSSEHKIPVASIPSHDHSYPFNINTERGNMSLAQGTDGLVTNRRQKTETTGGGEAYYPYYLGVYVWIKTAD